MSTAIPENIQAFNTITKILAHIPRKFPLSPHDNLSDKGWQTPEVRQELKLLNAFAQLMVSRYEVVAVTSNRSLTLKLMASMNEECKHADTPDAEAEAGAGAEPKSKLRQYWDSFHKWILVATLNSRRDDAETCSSKLGPTTVTPEVPSDLNGRCVLSYLEALEVQWHKPKLACHLWIVNAVLTEINCLDEGKQGDLSSALYRYIVAMSCQKIHGRLQNDLSQRFLASIEALDESEIKPPSQSKWIEELTGDAEQDVKEGKQDYCLMTEFLYLAQDTKLGLVRTSVTNLTALDIREPGTSADFCNVMIYTDKTYLEFHRLLKELLSRYERAIGELATLDHQLSTKGTADRSEFIAHILGAQLAGYALLKLSRGRAFRQHIENIGHMLHPQARRSRRNVNRGGEKPKNDTDNDKPENNESDEDKHDQEMEDAAATPHCVTWLRLMVAHLDAVDIILTFVTSPSFPYKSIETTLLLAPLAELPLYPWRKLIASSTYCPDPTSKSPVDNSGIVQFLENSMTFSLHLKQLSEVAKRVWQKWEAYKQTPSPAKAEAVKASLDNLLDATLPDSDAEYRETIEDALKRIEVLKKRPKAHLEKTDLSIRIVVDEVYPFPESNNFFCSLQNLTSLGTIHCEATLASLVNNDAEDLSYRNEYGKYVESVVLEKAQKFGRIIGVSKRCCPVCAEYLLQMEKISKGLPFIAQGVHSTLSPCTLPPWTASQVVDEMIKKFGAKLREDLLALEQDMKKDGSTFFRRNRASSTGSDSLSVHNVPSNARSKPNILADAKRRMEDARIATAAEARRRAAAGEEADAEEADAEEADAEEAGPSTVSPSF